jgi:hypothetical protein
MNNPKLHLIICLFFLSLNSFGQKCTVYNTGIKAFYFSDSGNVARKYEQISKDSSKFNALFVTKSGLTGKVKLIHVCIDSIGNMIVESGFTNSLLSITLETVSKADLSSMFTRNELNGFYESTCEHGSSEQIQFLLVSNPLSKKWIELVCFDGNIVDVLKENENLNYLYNIYMLFFDKPD